MKVLITRIDYKNKVIWLPNNYFRKEDIVGNMTHSIKIISNALLLYPLSIENIYAYNFELNSFYDGINILGLKENEYIIKLEGYKIEESMRATHPKTSTRTRVKKEFVPNPDYITTNWEDLKYTAAYLGIKESQLIFAKEQTKTNRRETVYNWIKKNETYNFTINGNNGYTVRENNTAVAGKWIQVEAIQIKKNWFDSLFRKPVKFMLNLRITGTLHGITPQFQIWNSVLGKKEYHRCNVIIKEI